MTVALKSLRVSAEMDAASFERGAKAVAEGSKAAGFAVKQMGEAIDRAGATVTQTDTKLSNAVTGFERFKRQMDGGYAAAMKLHGGLETVSRGLTQGAYTAAEAARYADALVAKYGQLGNASAYVARGQVEMAQAIEQANARLQKTQATIQRTTADMGNLNRAAANMNSPRGGMDATNIAYQFQDIGVTAAMGMSPMMIALQQGTQLSSVLGPMGAGGAVRGLGAAFLSLLSPVSLITVGFVGLTAAAIQYFTSSEDGASKSTDLFSKHNDAIRAAAQAWGTATPALKSYVDNLDRTKNIDLGRDAYEALAAKEFEGLSGKIVGINQQFMAAGRSMQQMQADPAFVRDFTAAFSDLRSKLEGGTTSFYDVNAAQRSLAEAMATYGTKELSAFSRAFDGITAAINRSAEAAAKARQEWIKSLAGGSSVQEIVENSQVRVGDNIYPTSVFTPRNPAVPTERPKIELEGLDNETKAAGARGALAEQLQARQQLMQTETDEIEKLRLEAQLVGASARERATLTAALDAEMRIRQSGIQLSVSEAEAYKARASAMALARLEIERQNAAYSSLQQAGGSAIDALTVGAGSLKDRFKSAADTMLQWVQQLTLANPIKNSLCGEAFSFAIIEEGSAE